MRQVSRLEAAARCAASRRAGWPRSPCASGRRGEPGSGGAGTRTRRSPARRGVEAGVARGRAGHLASAAFQLPSKAQWRKPAGVRGTPSSRFDPTITSTNCEATRTLRFTAGLPLPHVCVQKRGSSALSLFFFLSPQWPLHLEQVGEDVPISTSRVSCEARRRETPGTRPGRQGCPALCRRGPSLLAGGREARGGAGRKSCALPARGRCGPRLRPGPGSGGPGASRATDGRRAPPP